MQMQCQCKAIVSINASVGAISIQVRGRVPMRGHASTNIDQIYAQAYCRKQAAKQTHCPHNRLHANIQCVQSDPTQATHATCMHASDQYSCTRPACTQPACMHPTSIHIPDQCACIQRTNSPQVTQAPTAKHATGASYNSQRFLNADSALEGTSLSRGYALSCQCQLL